MKRPERTVPAKKPMSRAQRVTKLRFQVGDVFLSLGQRFKCEDLRAIDTPLGFCILEYELRAQCCDCRGSFIQYVTRSQIRREALRRRCHPCKKPGSISQPVRARRAAIAPQGAKEDREQAVQALQQAKEDRRKAVQSRQRAETAERRRLAALRVRRIQRLSAAMGQPVPPDISLGDLLQAEQRHIRKTRLAHQRAAWMLGVPLSEIAKMEVERRMRLRSQQTF
ncbi:hypothetical protein [Bosea sp. PAMC 26642]|uniref:hypothetical protein n=1 Tax=Bosea sp. (strain PAMC 26642) TaxID=1792307 RepID=UPI000770334F|nr:hypothetical protein [Bosea sp. PAMC 26642]AMJ63239.1 hypothetical protein AXW83_25670 [Bosea sp. PAMC 26642]